MSIERQQQLIQKQIEDILAGIAQAKKDKAENFTIKQMEKTRDNIWKMSMDFQRILQTKSVQLGSIL